MSSKELDRLRSLETTIEKLSEARVRASEQLKYLRQQRDKYVGEITSFGVDPKKVKDHLATLAAEIDSALKEVEAQIPPNLDDLLRKKD